MNEDCGPTFHFGEPNSDEQLRLLEVWFEDPDTAHWMAGCLPLERFIPWVLTQPDRFVRTVFMGGVPVAHVDVAVQGDRAFMSLIVDPARRGEGIGRNVLRFTLNHPELAAVPRFDAGIAASNSSSRRCFTAAGFVPESGQPDEDGFINYVWVRGT